MKFEEKKEKNAEHTRMYAQLCSSLTQYSRRLLSILAHQRKQKNNKKEKVNY